MYFLCNSCRSLDAGSVSCGLEVAAVLVPRTTSRHRAGRLSFLSGTPVPLTWAVRLTGTAALLGEVRAREC
jgi:hypothetical protein